ncbi:F-box protein [Kitasatospora mediocidica]|uniref:F-box protein n=1 Tax=Kitasatospora mediocidica TaxID=58352 RepID=UPI00055D75EE|nr:F-box protein [Kitasatospora mediocidica]
MTEPANGGWLSSAAAALWALMAPAVQRLRPDLLPALHQQLQAWPTDDGDPHDSGALPEDMWHEILGCLPLEDQARLAEVDRRLYAVVKGARRSALDPATYGAPDFVRTVYTQSELDASLDDPGKLVFTPGADSDLSIGRSNHEYIHVHGPGTLKAVTGGDVSAVGDALIISVTGGDVSAYHQARIGTVVGGQVDARGGASIGTVAAGRARARGGAAITTVTGGVVTMRGQATLTTVAGGRVDAGDQAVIDTVDAGEVTVHGDAVIASAGGGEISAYGDATIVAAYGDARISARQEARVAVCPNADGVHVSAHDQALVAVHGGTVEAYDRATVAVVTGGTLWATGDVAIDAASGGDITLEGNCALAEASGDARITVRRNARVGVAANADGVIVHAYDAAVVVASGGSVVVHSDAVTVANDGADVTYSA